MVAELPSEVLDVETPFGGARNIVPHLMKGEARLNFVLQRDDVILTRLHGPAAARALENHVRLIGHVTDVIPLPSDPAQGSPEGRCRVDVRIEMRAQQNAPSGGALVRQPD
jgi:hypothetical protein